MRRCMLSGRYGWVLCSFGLESKVSQSREIDPWATGLGQKPELERAEEREKVKGRGRGKERGKETGKANSARVEGSARQLE